LEHSFKLYCEEAKYYIQYLQTNYLTHIIVKLYPKLNKYNNKI